MLTGEHAGFNAHPWGATEGEEAPDDSELATTSAIDAEHLRDSSLGRPGARYLLARALQWPSEVLMVGLRVGIAAVVTGALAMVLPMAHPYWAIAFATLVLHQGGARQAQTVRGIQRLIGTMAGLGVYALILWWAPHGVWVALFLAVLQFSIELLVVRNYALAVTFITPLALTIASASGSQEPARRVIIERGADSLLAIGVALLVLMVVGRGTAVLFARAHARRVVVGMQPVLGALAAGG